VINVNRSEKDLSKIIELLLTYNLTVVPSFVSFSGENTKTRSLFPKKENEIV